MGRGPEACRLFAAVYPPEKVAHALLAMLDELHLPKHTRTKAGRVHMTVHFIGDTPARGVEDVRESVERAAAGVGSFQLRARALITLPRGPGARLVAAEFDAPPGLLEIHRRLVTRLARPARRERGHFMPHMTLCRFRHGARAAEIAATTDGPAFCVERITLVRSVLRPDGAEHRVVAEVGLEG